MREVKDLGKLRILFLRDILMEETDESHQLNAEQLSAKLEYISGERADRKTIYSDIENLRDFGMDIRQVKGSASGYYVGRRTFELSEVKLLVDAVQSSKFISRSKSDSLIRKLEKLTSRPKASVLQRQVFMANRVKTENDAVLLGVDLIHTAILQNRNISFQYGEWTPEGKMRLRRGGERYLVSPWALVWDNENYYLVAYSIKAQEIRHYRVDKMMNAVLERQERSGEKVFRDFDLADYMKKTFGMFGGKAANVTLDCDNSLAGVIIDRFGKNVMMLKAGESRFRVHVEVAVSPQFFGWAAGIGPRMRITGPAEVAAQYRAYLREILTANEGADH